MPPSITPGASAASPPAASPDAAPTAPQTPTVHAPVPPAPTSAPPAAAPASSPAPPPARQPAYQQQAYTQPAYAQPPQQYTAQPQPYGYTPEQYAYQQPGGPQGTTQTPAVAAGQRRKKKLTPGWIAFIALDVVLVVVALVVGVNALSGSEEPAVTAGDPAAVASPGTDGADDESGQADQEAATGALVAEFASPSRNISCQIFENAATCGLAELNQQPAPVEGCDGTTGYVVTLDGEGKVALPCVAKSDKPKKAPKKMAVLAYGDSTTEGDFTCTSEQDGMSCRHEPTGNGFSLARAGVGKL
ncbi:hypothetical protein [Isoptericola aurantiacus]|uniref:hypothetical protein n=1 Tax=Isoptericola aurantiacus TaxID=3377839 RepID=UPI003839FB79